MLNPWQINDNHFKMDGNLVTAAAVPPPCPSTSGSIGVNVVISLVRSNDSDTASAF